MRTKAAPTFDIQQIFRDSESPDLLVLTDAERCGRNALALPFQNATVIEVGTTGTIDIEGHFDAVVIDRSSYEPRWLDSVARSLVVALRPRGRVIVTLQAGGGAATTTEPGALVGLVWHGLGTLGGQPCAVLRPSEPTDADSAATKLLLTTAETAVRLAAARTADGYSGFTVEHAKAAMFQHLEERRRSERALVLHLEALAHELDQERRRYQGTALVRTVLRRSRAGRRLLRLLRPWWRVARKLRGYAGALAKRLNP